MIAEVYDALKEAGAGEEKSRAAAEAVASHENPFAGIKAQLLPNERGHRRDRPRWF